jgi:hypothetical protein
MARPRSRAVSKAPPAPTDLNLFALEDALAEAPDGIIRKIAPTEAPHLRRCIAAGLLAPAPGEKNAWCLSAAGISALAARRARGPWGFTGSGPQFLNRDLLMQIMAHAVSVQALSSTESVIFLYCWDRPSTIAEAVARLGLPRAFEEALRPGTYTTEEAREPFTLAELLQANRDWTLLPADLSAIASLAPGQSYALHLGAGGDTTIRCEGKPPRAPCDPFARRLSNILALYGKVLSTATPGGAS